MFAKATQVGFAQRVVATLVASAVVLWSIGVYSTAQAANLTTISDTLSDSGISAASNHTITFTSPTGVANNESITIDFSDGPFVVGSVDYTDIDVSINGLGDMQLAATCGGVGDEVGAAFTGTTLTLELCSGEAGVIAANGTTTIEIGTNATFGTTGDQQLTNPAAPTSGASYEVVFTAGSADTGRTRVVIISSVLVTASVATKFDFTVSAVSNEAAVNGTTTTGTTTATTIPFGNLAAGQIKTMAQQLNVTTNAANGYVVTVQNDGNLRSSTGADIDGFIDGAYTNVPTAWQAPGGTLGNENEYGHWGLTTTDGDIWGAGPDFTGTNEWVSASTTARAIMAHNSVSDGTVGTVTAAGDDTGQTIVGYQIEIMALQEAADDYQTTLTYIATPTF